MIISMYLSSTKYVKIKSETGDPAEFESTAERDNSYIMNPHDIILCGYMNSSLLKR